MSGRWAGSTRKSRLPRDWPQRVAAVRARAGNDCQASEHVENCTGLGAECDHIKPGDDHRLENLQWLSAQCHAAKTKAEASAALRALAALARHPRERHPGLL